jgi:hypothetical protein
MQQIFRGPNASDGWVEGVVVSESSPSTPIAV